MNISSKLSIIVPVYNVEAYIRECLDSIKNQTFTDFEVLLIDDGSPDNSGAICDEYAAKDSRFKVWHKKNGGLSSARNVGLDNAKGEWITFLDSDDYLLRNTAYEEIIKLAQEGNYDLINFGYVRDEKFAQPLGKEISTKQLNKKDLLDQFYYFDVVWAFFYKKSKIENFRFEIIKTSEDNIFTFSVFLDEDIKSMLIIDKPYIYYRQNLSSLTETFQPTYIEDRLYLMNLIKNKIKVNDLEVDKFKLNKFNVEAFFLSLKKNVKHKDIEELNELIKEYAPKFEIHKILSWNIIFENNKPRIGFLLIKMKLYKLAALYLKRKWG